MPDAGPTAPPSAVPTILGLAAVALLWVGCFDSDEKFKLAPAPSTTTTTGFSLSTSSGDVDYSTTYVGTMGCRDALDCLIKCFGKVQQMAAVNTPEINLGCVLDCDMGLTVEQADALLSLGECAFARCEESGDCEVPTTSSGSSSSSSSSGGGSSSTGGSGSGSSTGGSSSSTGGPTPPDPVIPPCASCVLSYLQEVQLDGTPMGCEAEAMACQ